MLHRPYRVILLHTQIKYIDPIRVMLLHTQIKYIDPIRVILYTNDKLHRKLLLLQKGIYINQNDK
jgi:hypothetical protein